MRVDPCGKVSNCLLDREDNAGINTVPEKPLSDICPIAVLCWSNLAWKAVS